VPTGSPLTCRPVPASLSLSAAAAANGASYHVDSLPRFLCALGFSCQRPQKQALERDEKVVARWVGRDWPRIKEKPPV